MQSTGRQSCSYHRRRLRHRQGPRHTTRQPGCHLALADINIANLEATAAPLRQGGTVVTCHPLRPDRAAVYAFADEVLASHGSAHLIINNAGVAVSQTVAELSYTDFEQADGHQFWGVVYGTKAFLPHLLKNNEGHIVNISSLSA